MLLQLGYFVDGESRGKMRASDDRTWFGRETLCGDSLLLGCECLHRGSGLKMSRGQWEGWQEGMFVDGAEESMNYRISCYLVSGLAH